MSCRCWLEQQGPIPWQEQDSQPLLVDLSAAFDYINANIVCGKLELLDATSSTVKLFRSYLTGRRSFTQINCLKSSLKQNHKTKPCLNCFKTCKSNTLPMLASQSTKIKMSTLCCHQIPGLTAALLLIKERKTRSS